MPPDYVGYDNELVGDDIGDEEEILGAVQRVLRGGGVRASKPMLRAAPRPTNKLRGYIGLGTFTFVNAGVTVATIIVEPQRGFRMERLVIARFNVGAASPGLACFVNNIFIGDLPQSPSQEQPCPTELFAPDATYSGIDFDVCTPGKKIQINLSISAAPAVAETVRLSLGAYGDMLRGS